MTLWRFTLASLLLWLLGLIATMYEVIWGILLMGAGMIGVGVAALGAYWVGASDSATGARQNLQATNQSECSP